MRVAATPPQPLAQYREGGDLKAGVNLGVDFGREHYAHRAARALHELCPPRAAAEGPAGEDLAGEATASGGGDETARHEVVVHGFRGRDMRYAVHILPRLIKEHYVGAAGSLGGGAAATPLIFILEFAKNDIEHLHAACMLGDAAARRRRRRMSRRALRTRDDEPPFRGPLQRNATAAGDDGEVSAAAGSPWRRRLDGGEGRSSCAQKLCSLSMPGNNLLRGKDLVDGRLPCSAASSPHSAADNRAAHAIASIAHATAVMTRTLLELNHDAATQPVALMYATNLRTSISASSLPRSAPAIRFDRSSHARAFVRRARTAVLCRRASVAMCMMPRGLPCVDGSVVV